MESETAGGLRLCGYEHRGDMNKGLVDELPMGIVAGTRQLPPQPFLPVAGRYW